MPITAHRTPLRPDRLLELFVLVASAEGAMTIMWRGLSAACRHGSEYKVNTSCPVGIRLQSSRRSLSIRSCCLHRASLQR